MIRYFARILISDFRKTGTLFLLTALGVALGVASVVAVQTVNYNAIGAFSGAVQAVSGEADLSVLGQAGSFPEELYAEVLAVAGVQAAWPLYQIDVALRGSDPFFLQIVGVDLFSPMRLPWANSPDDLSEPLLRPGWVAISPALAEHRGWSMGDQIEVSRGTRQVQLVIGALLDFQKVSPMASSRLAVMDIAQVQSLLGKPGEIDQIDIRLQPEVDPEAVISRLEQRLGPAVRVVRPEEREQQAERLMSAFRLNLTALSLISLLVGLFVVHTSTQASLVRRRMEFGILRCLGATRGQVIGLILGEVVTLGLVGVLIGLPLGYWVAEANVDMVSSTLTSVYLLQEIESVQLPPWIYALAVAMGVIGAVTGASLPALDASRRDTRTLLAAFTLHERARSLAPPLFVLGCFIPLISILWYWTLGQDWNPSGFVLALAVLVSLPLLAPLIVRCVCGFISVRSFGLGYSLRSLAVRLQTASFAVSSLAIAVSMLVGITLMVGSFRRTVEIWVDTAVRADIYISTESWRSDPGAALNEKLVEALSEYPGVAAMDRLRRLTVSTQERPLSISGVDMTLKNGQSRFPLVGGDPGEVFRRIVEEDAVLIGEPLARKAALGIGDRLVAFGPGGKVEFPIAGIYYDYSSEIGTAAMDLQTMREHFGPGPVNSVALYLESGLSAERVVDEIKARFSGTPLRIRSNRTLRREIFKIFDQTFAVVRILQVMSLLIAVCGIMLTLLVLARERISELALYRALGATRFQIFRVFVGKGLGMGLIGLFLGCVGGLVLAAILIYVINRAYFGWTIQAHWPGWPVYEQLLIIVAAALLASLYPAFRAGNTPATELSRDDL